MPSTSASNLPEKKSVSARRRRRSTREMLRHCWRFLSLFLLFTYPHVNVRVCVCACEGVTHTHAIHATDVRMRTPPPSKTERKEESKERGKRAQSSPTLAQFLVPSPLLLHGTYKTHANNLSDPRSERKWGKKSTSSPRQHAYTRKGEKEGGEVQKPLSFFSFFFVLLLLHSPPA